MKVDLPQYSVSDKNPRPLHRPSLARGMGDPRPIPCLERPPSPTGPGGTHTSLAGSARPSTTRTFRELLLAMAPSPKLSGQEDVQVPRLYRGGEGVYVSQTASLAPCPGIPAPPVRHAGS